MLTLLKNAKLLRFAYLLTLSRTQKTGPVYRPFILKQLPNLHNTQITLTATNTNKYLYLENTCNQIQGICTFHYLNNPQARIIFYLHRAAVVHLESENSTNNLVHNFDALRRRSALVTDNLEADKLEVHSLSDHKRVAVVDLFPLRISAICTIYKEPTKTGKNIGK
jgi:hypothetical protein